jgi:predicted extracellular nuclease
MRKFARPLFVLALLCLAITSSRAQGTPTVFINEIHYDNVGTDSGEFIEIAGPAGTDLAGYSLVLYNGNTPANGVVYAVTALSGVIPLQQGGYGTLAFAYGTDGIQNGGNDGIALVQGTTVLQFLSYEGVVTAGAGPASGMTSTDIGVSEGTTTPVGHSLQLTGTGSGASAFTWTGPLAKSDGAANGGQTFTGVGGPTIAINDVTVTEGNSGSTATASFTVTVSGAHPAGVTFNIATDDGAGATPATAGSGDYDSRSLVAQTIAAGESTFTFDVTVNGDANIEGDEQFVVNLSSVTGATVADGQGTGTISNDDAVTSDVVISQVYGGGGNNQAPFNRDFIELFNRGTSTISLVGWSVQYLSSSGTGTWQVTALSGSIAPGKYYLVHESSGANGENLPAADASGAIMMAAGAGKVALLQTTVASSGACPAVGFTADLVGYGAANCDEGAGPTGALSNTTAALRKRGGCFDSNNNNVDFSVAPPTPRNSATPARSCTFTSLAIHDIQGDGVVSPVAGQDVQTAGIVTARKSNGFFIQTTDDADSNPATSQGLFVFTSAVPAVAVGDAVTARGTATEFFNLTQLESSLPGDVTVDLTGQALPAAIVLTTSILDPAGTPDQLERFEGMRMHADTLVSVAPTNEFGETFTVLPGVVRPMREPGIEASLPIPPDPTSGNVDCCIPVWDENPERVMIDSDGLIGSSLVSVTSHVTFTNVTGPLDFAFGDYKVLPETPPSTSANISAIGVRPPAADELTIAGFNIENFNNNNDTQRRKAALAIRQVMQSPDVIGHVEIASLGALQALAAQVNADAAAEGEFPAYEARLVPAPQGGTQHLGFLIKTSRVEIVSTTQMLADQTFEDPVNHDIEILHDRPPLELNARALLPGRAPRPFIVVVNHLRSFIDIELVGGEGIRVRAKRTAQAEATAQLLQSLQADNPGVPVVSIGDYNAYQFNDGYTDPISILKGTPTIDEEIVVDGSPDLVDPDFVNLTDTLPAAEQYSFIFEGTPQVLDHVLLNTTADALVSGFAVARNNADFPEGALFAGDATRPERNSDHDMPVAYFFFPMTPVESLEAAAVELQAVLDGGANGALKARVTDALKKIGKAIAYLQESPADTHQAEIRIRQAAHAVEGLLKQGLLPAAIADEVLQLLADADP